MEWSIDSILLLFSPEQVGAEYYSAHIQRSILKAIFINQSSELKIQS